MGSPARIFSGINHDSLAMNFSFVEEQTFPGRYYRGSRTEPASLVPSGATIHATQFTGRKTHLSLHIHIDRITVIIMTICRHEDSISSIFVVLIPKIILRDLEAAEIRKRRQRINLSNPQRHSYPPMNSLMRLIPPEMQLIPVPAEAGIGVAA